MAVIKCKMCGGDLELVPDSTVCECAYCGTRQTVPAADDEKKLKLFERANRLRRACEFDKAAGVYESIVADFDTEAEAYWGLVLCKFGIEYVDDPATGKKVPTCHRAGFESVEDDQNYEQACENADAVARRVYREEGRAIDELRERILEVSGREEPYDVFISYKELAEDGERTEDSVLAQDIYDALTAKGYRVFFSRVTLEDKLGVEYEPYIFAALQSAKVMLLVGMDYENLNAVWVKNEWSRYLALMAQHKEKVLIPCYKAMDPYDLPKEVRKLAAQDMGKVGAMQDLLRGVEKIIPLKKADPAAAPQPAVVSGGPNVTAMLERGKMALEDSDWDKAKEFFDQALNMDAKCADAYFGLLLADLRLKTRESLDEYRRSFDGNGNYQKAIRFAPESQKEELLCAAQNAKQRFIDDQIQAQRAEEERKAMEVAEREARMKRIFETRARNLPAQGRISAGLGYTVGLMPDGTVIAVEDYYDPENKHGECDVSDWAGIRAVSAGGLTTVGLKADGTVLAVGNNMDGQCNVSNWNNIVAVAVGRSHTVGLRADGSVVAAGENSFGECNVADWRDVVSVAGRCFCTFGIKRDGKVLAAGDNRFGQCNISDWQGIVSIAAGDSHTVGLKADGTVIAVGENSDGRCNVSDWNDIVAISAGSFHTAGLKADGTVVCVGSNTSGQREVSAWRDIVALTSGSFSVIGLRADGTILTTYVDRENPKNITTWRLFENIDTLEAECSAALERVEAERRAAAEERKKELQQEQQRLTEELPTIKGLFAGSKKAKIEARLAEIASELQALGAE